MCSVDNPEFFGMKGMSTLGEECFNPNSNIAHANDDSKSVGNCKSADPEVGTVRANSNCSAGVKNVVKEEAMAEELAEEVEGIDCGALEAALVAVLSACGNVCEGASEEDDDEVGYGKLCKSPSATTWSCSS